MSYELSFPRRCSLFEGVGFSRFPQFCGCSACVVFLVRRARAGGHPGAEPRGLRDF